MNNVGFIARRAVCIHRRREHNFIFGERLLRHHRSRQVQFAPRPPAAGAEGAQVSDQIVNLLGAERFTERGHYLGKTPARPPMHDDILVCRIHLWGGLITLAEVRERARLLKSGNRFRSAPAIRAVTRFAPRFAVQLFALLGIGVKRITEILGMNEAL